VPADSQFPDLVGGLQNTSGLFQVNAARTTTGKPVSFACFDNKQTVVKRVLP